MQQAEIEAMGFKKCGEAKNAQDIEQYLIKKTYDDQVFHIERFVDWTTNTVYKREAKA